MNCIEQVVADKWAAYRGDCVEVLQGLPEHSIGYSIFSPPFASLYTYSNSPRDMGNCKTHEEFFEHFGFLVDQLLLVMKPGREVSFHCMLMPTSKERDGYIGLRDFRGDLIRAFQGKPTILIRVHDPPVHRSGWRGWACHNFPPRHGGTADARPPLHAG